MLPTLQDQGSTSAKRLWRCLCIVLIFAGCVMVGLISYTYADLSLNSQKFRTRSNSALGHVYTHLAGSLKFPRKDASEEEEYWPGSISPDILSTLSRQEKASKTSTNRTLKIFYWTGQYHLRNWVMGAGHAPFLKDKCPIHQCQFSSDPNAFNSSDFILVHQAGLGKGLPKVKLPGQKWIISMVESPVYSSSVKWANLNGKFEITMGGTLLADIYVPNLERLIRRSPTIIRDRMVDYAKGKNRNRNLLVAWFVSHCGTQSAREKYVSALQKHIHVDVYGACGPIKCVQTRNGRSPDKDPCMNMLHKQYKFYLAFENSLCEDYVTEKIWSLFVEGVNVVPVVLGGANYSRIFPPHSYIDVLDFDSPQHLAQYLYKLNENDTLYNEYFVWRDRYSVEAFHPMTCGLCSYLHSHVNIPQEVHRDLHEMRSIKKHCVTSKEYYGNRLKI